MAGLRRLFAGNTRAVIERDPRMQMGAYITDGIDLPPPLVGRLICLNNAPPSRS